VCYRQQESRLSLESRELSGTRSRGTRPDSCVEGKVRLEVSASGQAGGEEAVSVGVVESHARRGLRKWEHGNPLHLLWEKED